MTSAYHASFIAKKYVKEYFGKLFKNPVLDAKLEDRKKLATLCKTVPQLCLTLLSKISDSDTSFINKNRLDVIFGHFPSGLILFF